MKEFLKKYAEPARVALMGLGALLVAFGVLTTASAQLVIGASLSFGVAVWKLYDLFVNKNRDVDAYSEVAKLLLAALSTVLLTMGVVDSSTIQFWIGAGTSIITTVWTFISTMKK